MEKKNETSTSEYKRNRASKLSLVFTLDALAASPKPEDKTLEKREILKFHRSSASSALAVLVELERNFFLRISEWEGIVCVSTQRNGLKMVLVQDFQDLMKFSLICERFRHHLVVTIDVPSWIIEIYMKFHQIMRNQLRKLQSFHPKLTNTVSSGERGQWEYVKKDSTGKEENYNLIMLTFPFITHSRTKDTKSRPNDERTVCNGRSAKKESTEKRNSDDCVFKLDSFKTIECQW